VGRTPLSYATDTVRPKGWEKATEKVEK